MTNFKKISKQIKEDMKMDLEDVIGDIKNSIKLDDVFINNNTPAPEIEEREEFKEPELDEVDVKAETSGYVETNPIINSEITKLDFKKDDNIYIANNSNAYANEVKSNDVKDVKKLDTSLDINLKRAVVEAANTRFIGYKKMKEAVYKDLFNEIFEGTEVYAPIKLNTKDHTIHDADGSKINILNRLVNLFNVIAK